MPFRRPPRSLQRQLELRPRASAPRRRRRSADGAASARAGRGRAAWMVSRDRAPRGALTDTIAPSARSARRPGRCRSPVPAAGPDCRWSRRLKRVFSGALVAARGQLVDGRRLVGAGEARRSWRPLPPGNLYRVWATGLTARGCANGVSGTAGGLAVGLHAFPARAQVHRQLLVDVPLVLRRSRPGASRSASKFSIDAGRRRARSGCSWRSRVSSLSWRLASTAGGERMAVEQRARELAAQLKRAAVALDAVPVAQQVQRRRPAA